MSLAAFELEKFFFINSLPFFPMEILNFLFNINFFIAFINSWESFGGTSKPLISFLTISLQPGTSVVIIGFPQLAASRRPFGRPSLYEGKIPT